MLGTFCRLPKYFDTLYIQKNKAIMNAARGPRSCRLRQIVSRGFPRNFHSISIFFSIVFIQLFLVCDKCIKDDLREHQVNKLI